MDTILIVVDDIAVRNNIEIFLVSEGYDVIVVSNGLEALGILKIEEPQLIISDLLLPYVNGIELYKRILKRNNENPIPFIFLASNSEVTSISGESNLGASDFLVGPFEFGDLSIAVKNQIAKKKQINIVLNELKDSTAADPKDELTGPG